MNIHLPGSMTNATCTACEWAANITSSGKSAIAAGAAKVATLAVSVFKSLGSYSAVAFSYAKSHAGAVLSLLKAHPKIAMGSAIGLAALVLSGAAAHIHETTHRVAVSK